MVTESANIPSAAYKSASSITLPKIHHFCGDLPLHDRPIAELRQYRAGLCTLSEGTFEMLITESCLRLSVFRQPPYVLIGLHG